MPSQEGAVKHIGPLSVGGRKESATPAQPRPRKPGSGLSLGRLATAFKRTVCRAPLAEYVLDAGTNKANIRGLHEGDVDYGMLKHTETFSNASRKKMK